MGGIGRTDIFQKIIADLKPKGGLLDLDLDPSIHLDYIANPTTSPVPVELMGGELKVGGLYDTVVGAGAHTYTYTVPQGKKWVLLDILMYTTVNGTALDCFLQVPGCSNYMFISYRPCAANVKYYKSVVGLPLSAGTTIRFDADVAASTINLMFLYKEVVDYYV